MKSLPSKNITPGTSNHLSFQKEKNNHFFEKKDKPFFNVATRQTKLATNVSDNPYETRAGDITDTKLQRSGALKTGGNRTREHVNFSNNNISFIQRSPLSDEARSYWDPVDIFKTRDQIFDLLRNSNPPAKDDPDIRGYVDTVFTDSDDLLIAHTLIDYGPEPLWPGSLITERNRIAQQPGWLEPSTPIQATLTPTVGTIKPVDAYFFPGKTSNRALIIGGMHGSELSGVEVVELLIEKLSTGPLPYYTVIIVPRLFPDNIKKGEKGPIETGENFGRYTLGRDYPKGRPKGIKAGKEHSTDPNRQFPVPGEGLDHARPLDDQGRGIEPEDIILIELIDRYKPSRIANVHSNHTLENAGIYADPRADYKGTAIDYKSDEALALEMAKQASAKGAKIKGNFPDGKDKPPSNAVYPKDLKPSVAGIYQERDTEKGVSLGGWGSTAICDKRVTDQNRQAARVITVEINQAYRIEDMPAKNKKARALELEAHAGALRDIFLGDKFVEGEQDPCLAAVPASP